METYKSSFSRNDLVESKILSVVSYEPRKTFEEWVQYFANYWRVEVIVTGHFSTDGHGVKLRGKYANVYQCIADQWGSNETSETMELFVNMMLGDRLAEHLWNKGNESTSSQFNWFEHYEKAGYGSIWKSGESNPHLDMAHEMAIEVLAEAGYRPVDMDGDSPVDFAQTYLQLAFLHCPTAETLISNLIDRSKRKGFVLLDAFNLFVGATFKTKQDGSNHFWTVMEFTDGGEGAETVAEEKVLVRCRLSDHEDDGEGVTVRDFVFDYNDKVKLFGNVRNAHDLDDNNWGNH